MEMKEKNGLFFWNIKLMRNLFFIFCFYLVVHQIRENTISSICATCVWIFFIILLHFKWKQCLNLFDGDFVEFIVCKVFFNRNICFQLV